MIEHDEERSEERPFLEHDSNELRLADGEECLTYRSLLSLFDTSICLSEVLPLDFGPISSSRVRRTEVVPVSHAV